jgi:cyclohexanone monooxygenase
MPGFPNLFTIMGPNGPFTNLPPTIETQVEFISDVIEGAEKRGRPPASQTNGHGNGDSAEHANGHMNAYERHLQGDKNHKSSVGAVVVVSAEAERHWTEACDELSKREFVRQDGFVDLRRQCSW